MNIGTQFPSIMVPGLWSVHNPEWVVSKASRIGVINEPTLPNLLPYTHRSVYSFDPPTDVYTGYTHANDFAKQLFDPTKILEQRFAKPYLPKDYPAMPDPIADQSEDCLTLDVFVPKRIFDNENADLIPVIVSFHGGGFIFGSKTVFGSPAGILKTAGERGEKGDLIVVSSSTL